MATPAIGSSSMNDMPEENHEASDTPGFSLGRLVMALAAGLVLGALAAGLSWCFYDSVAPTTTAPMAVGTSVAFMVVTSAVWIGLTAENLRRAVRIGMASLFVVGFVTDACGAPAWATLTLGLAFAVMGFMLERKKEEVGDFSTFFDD